MIDAIHEHKLIASIFPPKYRRVNKYISFTNIERLPDCACNVISLSCVALFRKNVIWRRDQKIKRKNSNKNSRMGDLVQR